MPKELTREELWDAGVQYGHQTKRWDPKMKPYIYGTKNKNHIIDLQQTMTSLAEAAKVAEEIGKKQGKVLFVGTKRNAKPAVKEAALRSGNFYVNTRWLGGTLTNMRTISLRIKTLWDLEQEEKSGQLALRPKKEQILRTKEKEKLEKNLGGIKQMHKLPAAVFIVDPKIDEIAVKEARKLGIPVIAICDTNADPDLIDLVIPGNDDLVEAINILVNFFVDAYAEGAGLTMAPSVLKTKIVKKEYRTDGENQEGAPRRRWNTTRFENRDGQPYRENREGNQYRDNREGGQYRDNREPRENNNRDGNQPRENRFNRDNQNQNQDRPARNFVRENRQPRDRKPEEKKSEE